MCVCVHDIFMNSGVPTGSSGVSPSESKTRLPESSRRGRPGRLVGVGGAGTSTPADVASVIFPKEESPFPQGRGIPSSRERKRVPTAIARCFPNTCYYFERQLGVSGGVRQEVEGREGEVAVARRGSRGSVWPPAPSLPSLHSSAADAPPPRQVLQGSRGRPRAVAFVLGCVPRGVDWIRACAVVSFCFC